MLNSHAQTETATVIHAPVQPAAELLLRAITLAAQIPAGSDFLAGEFKAPPNEARLIMHGNDTMYVSKVNAVSGRLVEHAPSIDNLHLLSMKVDARGRTTRKSETHIMFDQKLGAFREEGVVTRIGAKGVETRSGVMTPRRTVAAARLAKLHFVDRKKK